MAWRAPLAPCAWPLAYQVDALLRGAWPQSYPYPCIDVAKLDCPQVLRNSAGLLVVFLLLSGVPLGLSRTRFKPPLR